MLALALAAVPTAVAWAALLGLGLHRHASPWAVSLTATLLLFGPPLAIAAVERQRRQTALATALMAWSVGLLLGMPVYFPGERRAAIATGLGLIAGDGPARAVADRLPDEVPLARPEVPLATTQVEPPQPPPLALDDHEIALPFEGEGRRLSVPVVFAHGDQIVEVDMMLDTGATYTTLPLHVLAQLGIHPGPTDPVIELHTANGTRTASVVLLDEVWLGDIALGGVAVATCEECAFSDTLGLLGLNVAAGFNMTIDSDRREVIFARRARHDRRLDVRQFADVSATFRPFAGGRVEVAVTLRNRAPRPLETATATVHCGARTWEVELGPIEAGGEGSTQRRLPAHEACDQYAIGLSFATW